MKPVRYIVQNETVLYNLNDYINLLLDAKVLHPVMPQLRKSVKAGKTPMQIVLEKLEKFEPAYYMRYNHEAKRSLGVKLFQTKFLDLAGDGVVPDRVCSVWDERSQARQRHNTIIEGSGEIRGQIKGMGTNDCHGMRFELAKY